MSGDAPSVLQQAQSSQHHEKRGRFLVLEGGEGAGKTTHAAFMAQFLKEKGIEVLLTREPGGTPLAEKIRDLIVGEKGAELDRLTEMSLFMAARHDHVCKRILPALKAGVWVICDRYKDSTYAYQVCGWGTPLEILQQFEEIFQFPTPDDTFLFDVPIETGLERAKSRRLEDQNRYDHVEEAFHTRVRQGFLQRAKEGNSYHLIDATQSLADIQQEIKQVLNPYIQGKV
jgi:dTMP kinase